MARDTPIGAEGAMRKFPRWESHGSGAESGIADTHAVRRGARLALSALGAALLVSASAAAAQTDGSPSAGAKLGRELALDEQIRHVLGRLAFGPRPGDVERVRAMGVDAWIARQLEPRRIEDARMDRFLSRFTTLASSTEELMREYPSPQLMRAARERDARARGDTVRPAADTVMSRSDSVARELAARASRRVLAELQTAKVARAVLTERQLDEVMVDFWMNHFSIFAGKGPERYLIGAFERDVIRPRALGRFRDLLGATASSPAMLFYLDNWQSAAEPERPVLHARPAGTEGGRGRRSAGVASPGTPQRPPRGLNENYARELLELHTVGVDGGYTQEDVVNVARAFTGWSLVQPRVDPRFVFRPVMHDAGAKVVLGQRLAPGRGFADGEQVLDILARHPATARHIATKLARRFVSDSPPPALVERAAATFRRTDGDIREVVRTIVTSPEFFSRAAYRAKVKSPFELVVSAVRAIGAAPDATPRTAQLVARLGQPLYLHQAPNGYPETGDAWINAGSILNRINFGLALAAGRIPGASPGRWPEFGRLGGASRAAQVDGVVEGIMGGEASADTRRVLEAGENPLLRASGQLRGDDPVAVDPMIVDVDPAPDGGPRRDPLGGPFRLDGLAELLGLAIGSPEFQRR